MSLTTRGAFITYRKPKTIYMLTALAISLVASICFAANTHAAGTVNVKDFGAVGDGVTDDSDAILAAFASDYSEIVFPDGEYKFTKQLAFAKGDKVIIGDKATLFADNDFVRPTNPSSAGAAGLAIDISNVNAITFEGLRFDARKSSSPTVAFRALIGVVGSNDIHFDDCDFTSDPNLVDSMVSAIDFYANWNNVSVTNSNFRMLHDRDVDDGGGVMFRNFRNNTTSSNAVFLNNTVYKKSVDEILWIANDLPTGAINNVEVSGNRFYVGDNSKTYYTIGTFANAPGQLRNIKIHNNEIIGQGNNATIAIEGVEDFDLYDNDIYTKISHVKNSLYSGSIFRSRDDGSNSPITTDTVKIHNNRTIALDSEYTIAGFALGTQPYYVYDNERVTINAPTISDLISHVGSFTGNKVAVNGNTSRIVGRYTKNFQDNDVLVNGYTSLFLQNWDSDLVAPTIYANNTIKTTKKRPNPDQSASSVTQLATMNEFSMNGHSVTIRGNTFVNGSEIELDDSLEAFVVANTGSNTVTDRTSAAPYSNLWYISVEDSTPSGQTAYICDNILNGFRNKISTATAPTINLTCNES